MADLENRDDAIASMQRYQRWAIHLAASAMYLEDPPTWFGDTTLDEYLTRVGALVDPVKEGFCNSWMASANSFAKSEDYESRLLQKRVLCLSGDHNLLGNDPPVQCRCQFESATDRAWLLAWKIVGRQLASRAPSRNTLMRFAAFERMAEEDRELYNELIWPPLCFGDTEYPEYLSLLQQIVLESRKRFLTAAWTAKIERAKASGDAVRAQVLENNLTQAQKLYKDVHRRWRPPQDAPPPAINLDDYEARTEAIGFDSAGSGIAGTWQYKGQVGDGSFGFASIWVSFDEHGMPNGRVVIKQVELGPTEDNVTPDRWNQPFAWLGDVNNRIPRDYGLVKPLNDLPYSENIIRVLAYAIYDMRRTYRVYLEYCEHGDLLDAIHKYKNHRQENDKNKKNGRIPVRMLWSLFEAFASAVCLMDHGQIPDGPPAPPTAGWQPMIHRDIKPENIFLTKSHNTNWPGVPIAKVADFGLAVLQSDPNAGRPGTLNELCGAPEQYDYTKEDPPEPNQYEVSHKSDIWAIGKLMIELIDLRNGAEKRHIKGKINEEWEPNTLVSNPARKFYEGFETWPRLRELIEGCLQKDPAMRPDGMSLLRDVQTEVRKGYGEPPEMMKMAPIAHLGMELRLFEEDKYSQWATELAD